MTLRTAPRATDQTRKHLLDLADALCDAVKMRERYIAAWASVGSSELHAAMVQARTDVMTAQDAFDKAVFSL